VRQLTQAHINMDAGGVQHLSLLAFYAIRLDGESLASEEEARGQVFACLLTRP
jgi:hypothetical protein